MYLQTENLGSSSASICFKKNNEPLKDLDVVENIAKIFEKEGADCWFTDDPQKFLGKKYKKEDYIKSNDIVEVWFDSGATHSYVLRKEERFSLACIYVFRRI